VDVGANLGYFSLAGASLGYDVVAFEPMSRNARKFSKSIYKNGFRNHVVLCQNAVTDLGGQTVSLQETDTTNQGNGQISASDAGESVTSVTLSDMFTPGTGHLSALSTDAHIVKIDVEGQEAAVLLGARKWICGSVVQHIIIEFSEATRLNKAYPAKDMFIFMQTAGYSVSDVAVGSDPIPYDGLVKGTYENIPPNLIFSLIDENSTC
jgi:FkbM family methyltransferase